MIEKNSESGDNAGDEMVTIRVPASAARVIEAQLAASTSPTMMRFHFALAYILIGLFWILSLGAIGWAILTLPEAEGEWYTNAVVGGGGMFFLTIAVMMTVQQRAFVARWRASENAARGETRPDSV